MGKYQSYVQTKDSEVDWLGFVPDHWEPKPLKYFTQFINGNAFKPSEWSETGTPIIRIENLNGSENFNCYDGQVDDRYHVAKEDLLFGWSGNKGTSFGPFLWWRDGAHYLNQHIFRLDGFNCDKQWFYWVLKAATYYVEEQAQGIIGMIHVTKGKLGGISIPSITKSEQRSIADFLDHETAKIDTLIEKQQQLIKLLKEKRQAVISHAVTKGLNPDARMKNSGVEWLGDVPEHWVISQLKYNTSLMQTGPFGSQLHANDYVSDGTPIINPSHLENGNIVPDSNITIDEKAVNRLQRHKLSVGDIIFARRGELGRCAIVKREQEGWICGTGSLKATLKNTLLPVYAFLLITSEGATLELSLESKGSTMDNLNTETLGRVRLPIPPTEEQHLIVRYVDEMFRQYELLIEKANTAITLMQERRTALISAAVTGKIDVRNFKADKSDAA